MDPCERERDKTRLGEVRSDTTRFHLHFTSAVLCSLNARCSGVDIKPCLTLTGEASLAVENRGGWGLKRKHPRRFEVVNNTLDISSDVATVKLPRTVSQG